MGSDKLTTKQNAFASDVANKKYDYIWEAYAANYSTKGWNQNSIYVEACKLRSSPKVLLRIKDIEDKIQAKEKITLDEIIVKLSQRVNLDIREMYNTDGSFKNITEMTQEQAMFIASFEVNEIWGNVNKERAQIGVVKKVKVESIKDILDMLVRHYGGYAKDKAAVGTDLDAIKEIIDAIKE